MLSKINRVDKKTMDALFRSGYFVNSNGLSLRFTHSKTPTQKPRVAFVVPGSLGLKSPTRNTLRRRGYSVVRKYINKLPENFIGAFIFKKKLTSLEIESEVVGLLEKYEKNTN